MKSVELPESFERGLICKVHVSVNGKSGTKELKVCSVKKARSVLFIEVDRENRKNIFRKINRKDIVEFKPNTICEIKVRDGVLPEKWESAWDSIGSKTISGNRYGYRSTTNSRAGFPMV